MLGGYPDIQSAIGAIDTSEDRNLLLSLALKKVYNVTSSDDILRRDGVKTYFKDRILTKIEIDTLKAETEAFQNSLLYKVLDAECRYQANKKIALESSTIAQLESGKLMLYIWDIVKTKLKNIKEL